MKIKKFHEWLGWQHPQLYLCKRNLAFSALSEANTRDFVWSLNIFNFFFSAAQYFASLTGFEVGTVDGTWKAVQTSATAVAFFVFDGSQLRYYLQMKGLDSQNSVTQIGIYWGANPGYVSQYPAAFNMSDTFDGYTVSQGPFSSFAMWWEECLEQQNSHPVRSQSLKSNFSVTL